MKPQETHFSKISRNALLTITLLAITSRLLTWFIAFISTLIIDDYDSSVDTILLTESELPTLIQTIFNRIFRVFLRWDSFYFLHIAEEGYVFEQANAFFPFYPLLIRGLGNSVLISNISFVLASMNLYKLSIKLFHDEKFAFITAIFYIITPSCVFMSAMYTESLFAYLGFLGMIFYVEKKYWKSAIVWSIASFTRSNGIVFIGFFVYELLIKEIMRMDLKEHYWNCGFLRYYEIKQIPNFVLASPMIILSLFGIYKYARYDLKRILSLNLISGNLDCSPYFSTSILPFIYLWAILLLYVITSMHIQVITRFFSSQPTVYWFASHLFINSLTKNYKKVDDESSICTSCLKKKKMNVGIYSKEEGNYETGDEKGEKENSNNCNKFEGGDVRCLKNERCSICLNEREDKHDEEESDRSSVCIIGLSTPAREFIESIESRSMDEISFLWNPC
ncbi:5125_t:CDS:2, partial [Diversispora eburnea]